MRLLRALVVVALALGSPAVVAQDAVAPGDAAESMEAPEAAWQDVISMQIQAFRDGDGLVALSFAGAGFQAAYQDPNRFYADIVNSGYAPLVQSRSHSFGAFQRVGEVGVMQLVTIVGPDQHLYSAIYQLSREPDGWRVQGVQLTEEQGIGI